VLADGATVVAGELAQVPMQNRQKRTAKLADRRNKSGSLLKQIQWNRSTKSMESFNKINGIVQRNQWICSDKLQLLLCSLAAFDG